MDEYIKLLKAHCKQYQNLLEFQTKKRHALAKRHQRQRAQLCETAFAAGEMADLLRQQTCELKDHYSLGTEHRIRLKQMQHQEKSNLLTLLDNR